MASSRAKEGLDWLQEKYLVGKDCQILEQPIQGSCEVTIPGGILKTCGNWGHDLVVDSALLG